MGLTRGARSFIEDKYRTSDQKILDPNIWLKDFPLDPGGLFLKTNNFVQQGLNRLLAYSPDVEKWIRVQVDSEGRLLTAPAKATAGAVSLMDRETITTKVLDGVAVGASELVTHVGLDQAGYTNTGVMVSSTAAITIYVQCSNDNTNWYDFKRSHDTDTTWACDAEKIFFTGDFHARYIRVLVYATAASTVTVEICQMV